jgi:hypothetical protein
MLWVNFMNIMPAFVFVVLASTPFQAMAQGGSLTRPGGINTPFTETVELPLSDSDSILSGKTAAGSFVRLDGRLTRTDLAFRVGTGSFRRYGENGRQLTERDQFSNVRVYSAAKRASLSGSLPQALEQVENYFSGEAGGAGEPCRYYVAADWKAGNGGPGREGKVLWCITSVQKGSSVEGIYWLLQSDDLTTDANRLQAPSQTWDNPEFDGKWNFTFN